MRELSLSGEIKLCYSVYESTEREGERKRLKCVMMRMVNGLTRAQLLSKNHQNRMCDCIGMCINVPDTFELLCGVQQFIQPCGKLQSKLTYGVMHAVMPYLWL